MRLTLLAAGTLLLGAPALAESPDDTVVFEGAGPEPTMPPPGTPPPADEVEDIAREIASGLRCPVCQGLSVSDSSSNAAVLMLRRVEELVAQGYTKEQIEDYWIARYGEWVLLNPTSRHWAVWVLPGVGFGVGIAFLATVVTRWRREPDEVPLPSDVGLVEMDPYEARLLAELED